MNKLTKTVLQRPVATLVLIAALIVFGIGSLTGMSLQLTPDMEMPVMLVMTIYPGAAPEDVEDLVTQKIEDGCGTIAGLDNVYSYSQENMSMVMFSFEYGTDMDATFIDMQAAVERIKGGLPDDVQDPTIIEMDMNAMPVMNLSVDAVEEGSDALSYVNDVVEKELKKISDVADLSISGGDESYISVELIPELMQQYKLNISSVADAVSSANYTIPAGSADYGSTQNLNISSTMEYKTPAQLAEIPITTATGNVIHLSDVANVHYAIQEPDSYSRYNGMDNVSVGITKVQSASAVTLSGKVMKLIDRLNAENSEYTITAVYDSSETIISSLKSVSQTLVIGVLITMVILFVFFGDIKGSLIVGSSMPISILATLILMSFMGFSLNMLTMGALVIAIGMIVDNSTVVIEMCFRKREEGFSYMDAAYEATKLVTTSLIASTATTVVVYLPLAMMEGLSGQLFKQLGYTIVFALIASLFSSITLVPLFFSKYRPVEKKEIPINRILERLVGVYEKVIRWALRRKRTVVFIAIGAFAASILLFRFVNVELMGQTDEGQVSVSAQFRPGTKLEVVDEKIRELEDFVKESPYISDYSATVTESDSSGTIRAYVADGCKLSTQEIVDEWNPLLAEYGDSCEITAESASSMGMGSMGGGGYEISLQSNDLEELKEGCRVAEDAIMQVDGVLTTTTSMADAASKAEIVIDPIKATAAGLTPQMASGSIYATLSGKEAMDVTVDEKDYTVKVEYPAGEYPTVNDVYGMMLTNTKGALVPLAEIAELVYTDSPTTIMRKDGSYQGSVTATISGADKFKVQEAVQQKMQETFLPDGVEMVTNSMDERMQDEFTALGMAILTAIFLVYIVMAIEFESLKYSGMVMFCIPFALIGCVVLLLLSRCTLSMTSLMGFLMLIGVVVNNGILYVDYTNMLRRTMPVEEALVETGKSRLRPILITTLTTVLSMVPMALGVGKNGEMTQGMAVVIVGGLTASTVLTLVFLPTLYLSLDRRSRRRDPKEKKRHFLKKRARSEKAEAALS